MTTNSFRIGGGWLRAATALLALTLTQRTAHAAAGDIHVPPGFRAELVYAPPLASQGSWVSLTVDDRGRLIASDQNGGLYRIVPSPLGAAASKTKVEAIDVNMGMAQGLLSHDGKLYVMLNGHIGAFASGLYRLSADGHGNFNNVEQLRVFNGEGEHGPHAIVLGPDGKSLYMCFGNFTELPLVSGSLVPTHWGEDQLLAHIPNPFGQGMDRKAPGGWIARTDLDGDNLQIFSVGIRNAYDMAVNDDGELFTFDSDMEGDIGTPWYQPIRVLHVTSGSDFGWRAGNGVWPQYYPDTLPSVIDVGQGSPTGMVFGRGTKFPPRYLKALFAGDWALGAIYAFHLTPEGSSYRADAERFASAMPMAVTDMIVRPQDGALYFTVGGRQSESGLYRIVWTGEASSAPASDRTKTAMESPLPSPVAARQTRHALEELHSDPPPDSVAKAWPQLASPDRFIRYAARIVIEDAPLEQWRDKIAAEPNVDARLEALVALALGAATDLPTWLASVTKFDFSKLSQPEQLNLLRAVALGIIRLGPLPDDARQQLLAVFDSRYPAGDRLVDRELSALLVKLAAPRIVDRMIRELDQAMTQEVAVDVAITLTAADEGWTTDQREKLLDWFDKAAVAGPPGGASYFGYLALARDRFIAAFPSEDKTKFAERLAKPYVQQSPQIASSSQSSGRPFVREWKLDELLSLAEKAHGKRDPASGRKMFAAVGCFNCHRIAGEGSSVGPDLTGVARRFSVRDILRSIVTPSETISDQYQQTVFDVGGKTIVGRITNLNKDIYVVSTNILDPMATIAIPQREIDGQRPSKVSMMPDGLLNTLTGDEILDMLAYLQSGGAK